jgi:hypothetical protein
VPRAGDPHRLAGQKNPGEAWPADPASAQCERRVHAVTTHRAWAMAHAPAVGPGARSGEVARRIIGGLWSTRRQGKRAV